MTPSSTLRAIGHPVRLQILSLLTGTEMSAAEVGRELDISQANASYHLRQLASAGLLVPAGEERIRGGTAKRYRHPWRREDRPANAGVARPDDREIFIQALAQEMVRRSTRQEFGASKFVDAELWIDPEVWQRCVDLVEEASILIHEGARPPRTEGTIHTSMSAALFRLAEPEAGS